MASFPGNFHDDLGRIRQISTSKPSKSLLSCDLYLRGFVILSAAKDLLFHAALLLCMVSTRIGLNPWSAARQE